ncbi:lytic transglycosylase domain-containing protein [Falsiroseomonas tokyonensis]|uniref:Transglycosylase SLT domain-containing protein n=1 Tax=Falsiroseomonas tokyonensis TaxID=430521 RepID=A0ABV7BSC2_9PROT|nr:lytic transglycosylase domain-containing protein [Falsiroseomonas tokyonensis]
MSVPRPAMQGRVAGFPQPLAPSDAARLRRIFELQARGEFGPATRELERLEDRRLLGHVLADRWLRPGAEPPLPDIVAWLADFSDHPDAPAIHASLVRRAPRGMMLPAAPLQEALSDTTEVVPEEREPQARRITRNPALDRTVRERARDGEVAAALAAIERSRAEGAYAALLKAEVAQALLQQGRDEEAFRIAAEAARQSGGSALPGYIAGLAAWALNRPEAALAYFEHAARSEIAAPATRAAAAFWTARAAVRARRPQAYVPWMMQAAQEPRTFYGLVARRALGLPMGFAWQSEVAGESEAAAMAETAGGWRALALLQIGQAARAEAELRVLWPRVQGNAGVVRAMLLVATQASMSELASQLAALSQSADGRPRDFARFPLPRLEPLGGFRMDPSLLYALARQESNFNPAAVSSAGARGILQIMPSTASYITGDSSLRGANVSRLHDAGFSLELGQRYVYYLARNGQVNGDLIRLLAAYNNGPGNMSRWLPAVRHRADPFLFIESIPIGETRLYVQRVLAYSWIYAARLGLPSPSLDALATGRFPQFQGAPAVAAMLISR